MEILKKGELCNGDKRMELSQEVYGKSNRGLHGRQSGYARRTQENQSAEHLEAAWKVTYRKVGPNEEGRGVGAH